MGAGGAGAVTFTGLLVADAGPGVATDARLGALLFGMLLTIPLAVGIVNLLREQGLPKPRAVALFGALLWLGGLGSEVFLLELAGGPLTTARLTAVLGGVALALGGLMLREPAPRAA